MQAQESDTASKPNWAQVLPLRLSQTSSRDGSSLIRYQNIANIEYLYNTNTSTFDRIDLSIDGQVVRLTVNPANSRQYSGSHNGILYSVDILHTANTVDALSNLEYVAELLFIPTYDATNSTNTNSFAIAGFETLHRKGCGCNGNGDIQWHRLAGLFEREWIYRFRVGCHLECEFPRSLRQSNRRRNHRRERSGEPCRAWLCHAHDSHHPVDRKWVQRNAGFDLLQRLVPHRCQHQWHILRRLLRSPRRRDPRSRR